MDKLEKKLKALLFRSDCPSKMDLGEYELGILGTLRRDELATHLTACPHCQYDLVQMRQFMADPAVGIELAPGKTEQNSPLLDRIKVIVVDLLSLPAALQGPAAFQPVFRGAEKEMRTSVVEADEYIVALTAQDDEAAKAKRHIIGDITALIDDDETFENWTANLWSSGRLLASTPIASDSHFIFEDVRLDERPHDLILSSPNVEIHLQNLQIA